jgi:hypothetical protein
LVIYRAISVQEKQDLEVDNKFRSKEGAYEGKLFAQSLKDATIFGKNFYIEDDEPIFVVEVDVDDVFFRKLYIDMLDESFGVAPSIAVDRDQLDEFNNRISIKILDILYYA